MLYFLGKKIAYAGLSLFGVITVVFLLFHVLPADPARMMLDQNENTEQLHRIKKKYGFDKPIATQYGYYINDISMVSIHAKNPQHYTYFSKKYTGVVLWQTNTSCIAIKLPYLRESFQKTGKKVSAILAEVFPNTLLLASVSIIFALVLGLFLGVISALYKDTWLDKVIQITSTLGMSTPSFFSAIVVAWLFGFVWHRYTGLSMTGSLYAVDDFGESVYIAWQNVLLPAFVLGIRPLAVIVQLMRNALLEVLSEDYIKTAHAKGLSIFSVLWRHAIKNALNPVVTAVSGWFASMLAGAVFVEYIFGWNGLGKMLVDALNTLDLPVIMGAVLLIATIFIVITIFVDLIYSILNPKI